MFKGTKILHTPARTFPSAGSPCGKTSSNPILRTAMGGGGD